MSRPIAIHPTTLIVVLPLRPGGVASDIGVMPWDVPLSFALLAVLGWGIVARAVLVYTRVLPPTCGGCGLKPRALPLLGRPVCRCGVAEQRSGRLRTAR
jgi:hypothetical protein